MSLLHLATASCSTAANPATLSGMSHACRIKDSSCARPNGDPSSLRDFQSTLALLLTTVLSEAWKPIALFGQARGSSVFFEPGIAGPRDLWRLTLDLASRSEIGLDSRG